ncbi:MAG: hypothetical protein LBD88_05515 [Candidatus Peribacteria bacterium]|nr:hypothetical protein [Candidatus Peribacteria bacterium]
MLRLRLLPEKEQTSATPSLLRRGIEQNLPPLQGGIKGGFVEKFQNTALVRELHTF